MPDPLPAAGVDDTRTTNAAVQRISDDQAKMAADIAEIKALLETTPLAKKLCETIDESGSLKKCIKKLMWTTLWEKILYLIAAGLIFAATVYSKELITRWMNSAATETANHLIDQRITTPVTSQQTFSK